MIGRIKTELVRKGMTTTEFIAALTILFVITASITGVVVPAYLFYRHANEHEEANTLLNSISSLIMNDIANATEINTDNLLDDSLFMIRAPYEVMYLIRDGIIFRSLRNGDDPVPLLHRELYGDKTISVEMHPVINGVVSITLTLVAPDGWVVERTYTARPVGL